MTLGEECGHGVAVCFLSFDIYSILESLRIESVKRCVAMTQLDPCDLLCLPDEVIQTILSYTPPQSVVSVHATCRRLAIIASGPLLWRSFCQAAFTWWDKRHDIESKLRDASFTEWEALYKERHLASQHTRDAFANLMSKEEGKLDAVQCFLDTGYDAKDVLIAASKAAYESDMYLAQR